MDEKGNLAKLSDDELLAILRVGLGEKNWTLREMIEIERRGDAFLSKDSALQDAIQEVRGELQKKISQAMAPALESFKLQADFARKISDQLQGISQNWREGFGTEIAKRLKLDSAAYESLLAASRIAINPELTKIVQLQSPAYESLLAASRIAINPEWTKRLIANPLGSETASAATLMYNNLRNHANTYKNLSENLLYAGAEIKNKIDHEYLPDTVETATLDLPVDDPKVTTSVTENFIREMENVEDFLALVAKQELATSISGGNQPPITSNRQATAGGIPRRIKYLGFLVVGALLVGNLVLLVWK